MRLLAALLSISLFLPTAGDFEGRVISVFDGDTVTVLHNKKRIKVRLDGIDAPERYQHFGAKSKSALTKLLNGKTVTVLDKGTDEYDQVRGIVTLSGKNINEQMISDGWAWHDKESNSDLRLSPLEAHVSAAGRGLRFDQVRGTVMQGWASHDKESNSDLRLSELEAEARAAGRGLWVDRTPIPPWEYRKQKQEAMERYREAAMSRHRESRSASISSGGVFWLNTNSNVRHNFGCQHYRNTINGRSCGPSEGRACGICGG
jgi:micrococcal nuclease